MSVRFSCDPEKVHMLIYTGRANLEILSFFNFILFLSFWLMSRVIQHCDSQSTSMGESQLQLHLFKREGLQKSADERDDYGYKTIRFFFE